MAFQCIMGVRWQHSVMVVVLQDLRLLQCITTHPTGLPVVGLTITRRCLGCVCGGKDSAPCHGKGEGELSPTRHKQHHVDVSGLHHCTLPLVRLLARLLARHRIASPGKVPNISHITSQRPSSNATRDQRAEQSRQSVAWNRDAYRCTQPTACSRLRGWLSSKFNVFPRYYLFVAYIAFCRQVHCLCEAQSHCIRQLIRFQADTTFGDMCHSQTPVDVFALLSSLHLFWSLHCLLSSCG